MMVSMKIHYHYNLFKLEHNALWIMRHFPASLSSQPISKPSDHFKTDSICCPNCRVWRICIVRKDSMKQKTQQFLMSCKWLVRLSVHQLCCNCTFARRMLGRGSIFPVFGCMFNVIFCILFQNQVQPDGWSAL